MVHHLAQHVLLVVGILATEVPALGDDTRSALFIIDMQDCFLPGGSLAVTDGEAVIPIINRIREQNKFDLVIVTLDWHPAGHVSFASSHNKSVGNVVSLRYLENGSLCLNDTVTSRRFPKAVSCGQAKTVSINQTLWPDHCIQNLSTGPTSSLLSDKLTRVDSDVLVHKGNHQEVDAYSAFFDNGKFFNTDLDKILKSRNISRLIITGLALDFCVFYTSEDAKELGYDTYVVVDASRGVDPKNTESAKQILTNKGVKLISHTEIPGILQNNSSSLCRCCLTLILAVSLVSRMFVSY